MKYKFIHIFSALLFITLCCFFALPVFAQSGMLNAPSSLPNPIGSSTMTITDVFIKVLQISLGLVSLFALIMFVYGGLLMLTSAGNPDRVQKAKDTLVWALLGLAVIIFSGAIVRYVFENFQF